MTKAMASFGPAGNSITYLTTVSKSSLDAPAWLRAIGLDTYEYQCGKGVNVGEETARKLGAAAAENGIVLSLHAPYFINLANPDPEMRERSMQHVLDACRAAQWMGAVRVVIHSGALMKRDRQEAFQTALAALKELICRCAGEGFAGIALCLETMGKINQLGTLDEVLTFCAVHEGLIPCVDFGHLYARSLGREAGEEAYDRILSRMEEVLGAQRAAGFHSHFSKIAYTEKGGELRHLNFDDPGFGPDFEPLARQVAARGWHPVFICESAGSQSEDALAMKNIYQRACRDRLSGSG